MYFLFETLYTKIMKCSLNQSLVNYFQVLRKLSPRRWQSSIKSTFLQFDKKLKSADDLNFPPLTFFVRTHSRTFFGAKNISENDVGKNLNAIFAPLRTYLIMSVDLNVVPKYFSAKVSDVICL